jgi:sulfur relay (sulfurtransferase) DsrC/TusE family protein
MSKSLKSKLNFLNQTFWTKLDFEDFKLLLNKIGWLETEKHIENYIKKVISAKLSSEKYEWVKITDKAIFALSEFFKNYYRSFSEVPSIGMINVNTGLW